MTSRLFIFGLGYCGLEIAKLAMAKGWKVGGTCMTGEKAAHLRDVGIDARIFDGSTALEAGACEDASHVLCTIAPATDGDPVLRTGSALPGRMQWLGYLSTTGVYGDHGGGWVDETTPPRPAQPRSITRLAAERAWQERAAETGTPLDIFRLPGIYGPGRSAIDRVKAGTARRIDKPGQFLSRIHVEDVAAAVLKAMSIERAGGAVWNVADDLPAPNSEVIAYAFELLGLAIPPAVPWEKAASGMSAMARSFYVENRRVRNDRLKRDLGVTLRYPTYREGLKAIAGDP